MKCSHITECIVFMNMRRRMQSHQRVIEGRAGSPLPMGGLKLLENEKERVTTP